MRVKQTLIEEIGALIRQGKLDEARAMSGYVKLLEAIFQIPRCNRRLTLQHDAE